MRKIYRLWICVVAWSLLMLLLRPGYAQPLSQYTSRQKATLGGLGREFQSSFEQNYQKALELANRQGRPLTLISKNRVIELQGIDELGNLLYVGTNSATRAGATTRTNSLYSGGSLGVNLSGSSPSVRDRLGMWEVRGRPRASHQEFGSRLIQRDQPTGTDATGNLHSTHVSGILIAAGKNPLVRGMAYGANLQAYDATNDASEMTTVATDLLVSNHSYGTVAGWYLNTNRTGSIQWEWYGDTTLSATDDYKFGFYNTQAQTWDRIAYNAPYYLIVKAAGNERGDSGPGLGAPYYLVNHNNRISTRPRYDQSGYDLIGTYGTAKNILTVGAVSNTLNGYNQPADVKLGGFSSWGPTDDGRIKPDIAGVGVNVLSTYNTNDSSYAVLNGTSMASPNVTGSLLVLQEYYSQRSNGQFMRSATLKGLVLHTADEAGEAPGPDYSYGWGLLNVEQAARVIQNADGNHVLEERILDQGQTFTRTVVASGRGPLVATICWTDPDANATAVNASNVNSRTPKLINDLDIRITDGRQTSLPWILDPDNPGKPATRGDNIRDNVEQVLIANTVPGQSYTISISHKNNLSGIQQNFALIISGIGGQTYCASGPASSADSKFTRLKLGDAEQAGATNCTTYSDFTQTVVEVQAGGTIPISVTVGSCGTPQKSIVRVFADWNANGNFTDAGDTLATSAVLNGIASFAQTVTVPSGIPNGHLVRVRFVLAETTDPTVVSACGTFAKGETLDVLLRIIRAATDVGIAAFIAPETSFCSVPDETVVALRVRNFGTVTQRNIPVRVRITDASNTALTVLSGMLPVLSGFSEGILTLKVPAIVRLQPGQTYRFEASTDLTNDQNASNNQLIDVRTTASAASVSLLSALQCGSDTLVSLTNGGAGTAFWYDAATGGKLLAIGNRTTTRVRPGTTTYFVAANDFSGTLGPVSKAVLGGGTYAGNFGPTPLISTRIPALLESARLYIASAGRLTFTIRRLDNTPISSVSLEVTPTRNPSLTATNSSGQLEDDPDDLGAEYPLNLQIPAAGDYKITIDYEGGASLFRSNVGVTGFPYQVTAQNGTVVVSARGSLFTQTTGRVDTLTNAWYYLYNLKVRSLGCPTQQRTPVTISSGNAPTAMLTVDGSATLCRGSSTVLRGTESSTLTYQWYRNNQVISGATTSSYRAVDEGTYSVQVSNNCLPAVSNVVQVTVRDPQTPSVTLNGLMLSSNAVASNQWLFNGVPISGATSQTYAVVQSGRYSVRANVNGCGELISSEVSVVILATEEPANRTIHIFPNPTNRYVNVETDINGINSQPPTMTLINSQGIHLQTVVMKGSGKKYSGTFDLSNLPDGMFFVTIKNSQSQILETQRIVKQ